MLDLVYAELSLHFIFPFLFNLIRTTQVHENRRKQENLGYSIQQEKTLIPNDIQTKPNAVVDSTTGGSLEARRINKKQTYY